MESIILHPGHHGTGRRTTYGFITDDYQALHRFQNFISGVCAWIAGTATVTVGVLTVVEVFMRGVLARPLGWNVGFSERYLMVAIAFFGLVTAYRTGAHIAVASLYGKFAPRTRKVLMLLTEVIVAGAFLSLAVAGVDNVAFSVSIDERIPPGMADLPWPSWTWRILVPTAAVLGFVVVAIDIFRELTTSWSAPATDYEPGEE